MGEYNIEKAVTTENKREDFSVDPVSTDAATDQNETWYMNENATQQLGYYKTIPELRKSIDAAARWTNGKGFQADEITSIILARVRGNGKDSFNSILRNLERCKDIYGDAYAEIILDKDDFLLNLKPLDPSVIRIVANKKGIIIRYDQTAKTGKKGKAIHKFQPEEIFHLSRNRIADEIHGISVIDALTEIILARNEAMADWKTVLHRNVVPVIIWYIDTDKTSKLQSFKNQMDLLRKNSENLVAPMNSTSHEILSIPGNATLNPLATIQQYNSYFFQSADTPQIMVGGSQEITEATAKILYLVFEQTTEERQLYQEEMVLNQLNLVINLEVPASLQNDLLSSKNKEETMQAATPEDTSVTNTGVEQ